MNGGFERLVQAVGSRMLDGTLSEGHERLFANIAQIVERGFPVSRIDFAHAAHEQRDELGHITGMQTSGFTLTVELGLPPI